MLSAERCTGRASSRVHGANVGGKLQKKCAYCRKPIEEGKEVKMTILIIHGSQLAPRERTYCSTKCGQYDQMANEA
ncbi:YdaE family protein [Klebsiella aerogenes]|uniref:YdaE family protein n=1 Tax=Klebsiella aerogenes TaxID=548 RepID=UPI0035C949D8